MCEFAFAKKHNVEFTDKTEGPVFNRLNTRVREILGSIGGLL